MTPTGTNWTAASQAAAALAAATRTTATGPAATQSAATQSAPTPRPPARRSLQARLALAYAAGIYAAGIVVLVIVDLPLVRVQSTAPRRPSPPLSPASPAPPTPTTSTASTTPGALATSGHGIGPHQLLTGSAIALVLLIPLALALGWFVAGRFLRPLRAITATADAISAGNLHRRLALGEPVDELTGLGSTLDELFARLEAAFDAQRHFVANVSHELRTPLAGLRTLLEVALADPDADAETLRAVCREALDLGGHQERLVHALLVLATSERGVSRHDRLDLAQIAGRVLASRRDQAAERGVDLAEHLAPAVTAGDPRLVESLIANLVDNALRHNHPGGHAQISTETSGPWVGITVSNSGSVIPEDQIQRLFQAFQRLSPGRNDRHEGYGLGLAIVSAVARAHHAALDAGARPEGGLCITVRFARASGPREAP